MAFAATEVGCSSKCSVVNRSEQSLYGHGEVQSSLRPDRSIYMFGIFVADCPSMVVVPLTDDETLGKLHLTFTE